MKKGSFKVPGPPANFAGAQWAPHVFLPFPINVKPVAAAVKEILKQEERPAAAAPSAPAPTAGTPPVARPVAGKSTFTVLLKTPDLTFPSSWLFHFTSILGLYLSLGVC